MTCREFTDFLMAYVDEELPAAERRSFEQHIGDCPPCLSYLDSYKDAVRLGNFFFYFIMLACHVIPPAVCFWDRFENAGMLSAYESVGWRGNGRTQ